MIGLLFLLLPVFFGLISKKLEKAGDDEGSDEQEIPSMPEVFPTIRKYMVEEEAEENEEEETFPAEEAVSSFVPKQHERVIVPSKTIEEEQPRKKDPIDPKKLVIYSEIMKPKF